MTRSSGSERNAARRSRPGCATPKVLGVGAALPAGPLNALTKNGASSAASCAALGMRGGRKSDGGMSTLSAQQRTSLATRKPNERAIKRWLASNSTLEQMGYRNGTCRSGSKVLCHKRRVATRSAPRR
jgi:hypothetical protein